LAVGNLHIGQITQAYRLANKAKRSIDIAIANSVLQMNNMREMLGERDIDALIDHIEENYPQFISATDREIDDFDENLLDFSKLQRLYQTKEQTKVTPQFTLDSLKKEVVYATFNGLTRINDELIYFDKLTGDVLIHVQGYFSSLIGDQSLLNRRLAEKIMNNEPQDLVDEKRYLLIDRLQLSEFLNAFKAQSNGKKPFHTFPDLFAKEIFKEFSFGREMTINDLAFSSHIQQKFHELFQKHNTGNHLKDDYTRIFENTCKSLALKWIRQNVFNNR
jgi:hypothetical protein